MQNSGGIYGALLYLLSEGARLRLELLFTQSIQLLCVFRWSGGSREDRRGPGDPKRQEAGGPFSSEEVRSGSGGALAVLQQSSNVWKCDKNKVSKQSGKCTRKLTSEGSGQVFQGKQQQQVQSRHTTFRRCCLLQV